MADTSLDSMLDDWLHHREPVPGDTFVLQVMYRSRAERRQRRRVLLAFGLAGAAFGAFGAWQLTGPIASLLAGLPPTGLMQGVLLTGAAAAFYAWFMNDDLSVHG